MFGNQQVAINELVREAFNTANEKGWNEKEVPIPESFALMHSEISEALEDYRVGRKPTETYFVRKVKVTIPDGLGYTEPVETEAYVSCEESHPDAKPCGIPIEIADLLIRALHFCGKHDIDLGGALKLKMAYNATREYRHGGKLA